jgi:hypothetical protein
LRVGRAQAVAPDDVVSGVDRAVVVEVARQARHGGERYFAGGVELGEVPGVGAGDGERAGGRDAGPIKEIDRPAAEESALPARPQRPSLLVRVQGSVVTLALDRQHQDG